MKYTIIVDKQSSENPSTEKKEYTIDIEELRTYKSVSDTLKVTPEMAYVIRRLALSEYGILSILDEPKQENIKDLNIELFEGDNYIYILNQQGNKISASYIIKNDFTDSYPTKAEMNSAINQSAKSIEISVSQKLEGYSTTEEMKAAIKITADGINNEVSKKVGEDELGTKIEQNPEAVKVAWNQLSQYIKFEGDNKDATIAFYDNNAKFGEMGVNTLDGKKYISFAVPVKYGNNTNDGMAWGIQTEDNKFYPILFIRDFFMANKQAGNFGGNLVLNYCDFLLGTGAIKAGNVRLGVDDTANGIYFEDTTSGNILMRVYPDSTIGYARIDLLNSISFYKNQGGTNSFKIGLGNNYILMTDNGNFQVSNGDIILGTTKFPVNFSIYAKSIVRFVGNLHVDGNVYADNISSDKRLKEDIKDSNTKAIDLIKKISHKQFKMKKNGIHYDIGYIAQELEEIDKNFVLIKKENEKEDGQYYINELPILATATKAIQELEEKIQEQQKRIEDLENKIKEVTNG